MVAISILKTKEKIFIKGDSESLETLGSALLLKAKLGLNLSCTFKNGEKQPIKILLDSESY